MPRHSAVRAGAPLAAMPTEQNISQIALTAVEWATQQLRNPASSDAHHNASQDLRFDIKETCITSGIIKRTLHGFSKKSAFARNMTFPNFRAEEIVAITNDPTRIESQISLCFSFLGNIRPEDVATTPLAPLLTHLQLHRSYLPRNIAIDPTRYLALDVDGKIIHCIMRNH